MFIYTVKWNKKTAIILVALTVLIIVAIILAIGAMEKSGPNGTVRDNDDRVSFLASLGWEVVAEPVDERTIIIPQEFSEIYSAYNRLQLAQGYDLSQYCGLEVTVYSYTVTNYSSYRGNVVCDLYVLNFEVIGGDVHSLELDGFMHGLILK